MNFQRLNRATLRTLAPGERIAEHGIYYEKLKDGDGRFGVQFRADGQRINRVIGKESEGVTREYAEAFVLRIRTEAREGRLRLPKGRKLEMRFKEAAQKYLDTLKEIGGRDLVAKDEHFRLHFVPVFGNIPISQIDTFAIEKYQAQRKNEGAAPGSINRELATMSHLYTCAVTWKWIYEKPFRIKKLPEEAKRITYLTPEQCKRLLQSAKQIDRELHLFILIGLGTAMRSGEIMSIRLENIDLNHLRIFIPKAKAGARNQPISKELSDYLADYLKKYCTKKQVWLFPATRKNEKRGHRTSVTKSFKTAVINAGLDPKLVLRHTLRHTAISLLVQSGVDLPTVMTISGHKTLRMVERYSHRDGKHIQAAMDKLEDCLNVDKTQQE